MTTPRPDWLAYRTKDGVFETHFNVTGRGSDDFSQFIRRAISWSDRAPDNSGPYYILDTFLSDTLGPDHLEMLLRRTTKELPLRVLLLDPRCNYARARAEAIGQSESTERAKNGLRIIAQALMNVDDVQPVDHMELDYDQLASWLHVEGKKAHLALSLYSVVPGGPLFIFRDVLVAGRYSANCSSIDLPWSLVVNDSQIDHDLFDVLVTEFQHVWNSPRGEGASPAAGGRGEYRVFISYSHVDEDIAKEVKERLEGKGIDVFLAASDVDPGTRWNDELRRQLLACSEVVVIVSRTSEGSVWVHRELGAAWAARKRVTPALVGAPPGAMEMETDWQAVSIETTDGKRRLVDTIGVRASTYLGAAVE